MKVPSFLSELLELELFELEPKRESARTGAEGSWSAPSSSWRVSRRVCAWAC